MRASNTTRSLILDNLNEGKRWKEPSEGVGLQREGADGCCLRGLGKDDF